MLNTYEIKYKLDRMGNINWCRMQAESIDEISKSFRKNTYPDYPDAMILSIRKETT